MNIILSKLSSPSATPKSVTTMPQLTATPELLNSKTPALLYFSASTVTMEDLIPMLIAKMKKYKV